MRCPSCEARLTSKDIVGKSSMMRAEYKCHTCSKVLAPAFGTAYFIFFILIGAPVIEAILHWILESLFHPVFDGMELFGIEVIRVLSATITLIVLIGIYFQLNKLKEVSNDQPDAG